MNVSIKNTKQEILNALHESQKQLKELKNSKFDPITQEKEKQVAKSIESADNSVQENLFSEELSKKYTDLRDAIAISEERLKELYDIDKTMADLTLVVNASNELQASLKKKNEEQNNMYKELMDSYKTQYDEEVKKLEAERKLRLEELKKMRTREEDEYNYELSRKRSKENDAWEDEKSKREIDLAEKELLTNKLLKEAEDKRDYYIQLEEKIAELPTVLEAEHSKGLEEGKKEAGKEYGYQKTMAAKDAEYKEKMLQNQIDRLTADLAKADALVSTLQESLNKAYSEIREIATKTVESTGGIKVISGNGMDSNRK